MSSPCSTRIPMRLEMDVFSSNRFLGRGVTRDIDPAGTFLETPTLKLYPNDIVELDFADRDRDVNREPIKAIVVRRTDAGIDFLFTGYSSAFYQRMAELFGELLDLKALRRLTANRTVAG
jgi:hypothetical protein